MFVHRWLMQLLVVMLLITQELEPKPLYFILNVKGVCLLFALGFWDRCRRVDGKVTTLCNAFCSPSCTINQSCVSTTCVCKAGFYGSGCTDKCEDSGSGQCQNGGTCNNNSPRTCDCNSGYTGDLCESSNTQTTTESNTASRKTVALATLLIMIINLILSAT